jgi:hypothetical protein
VSNERIADLEKRHADLALKDLGASEISEEFVLTRRRLFRQTCLYGGRNRRQIAA